MRHLENSLRGANGFRMVRWVVSCIPEIYMCNIGTGLCMLFSENTGRCRSMHNNNTWEGTSDLEDACVGASQAY